MSRLRSVQARAQVDTHREQSQEQPRGFVFGQSPYLTAREAADYVRCVYVDGTPNVRAFYKFVARHRVTKLGASRGLRFDRRELDRVLQRRAGGSLKRVV